MTGPRELALSTPQRVATRAGERAFQEGGNAFDACIAACLSLAVTYPDNCALGGDLIAIVRQADGSRLVINASGPASALVDPAELRRLGGRMPDNGPHTVTVPGLIGGLGELWTCGAALGWDVAFATAVEQARDGIPVVPTLAASIAREAALLGADDGCREIFFVDDRPLEAGDLLRQSALAETLEQLAAEGPDAFYDGPIGRTALKFLGARGSQLTQADLARFSPERRAPEARLIDGVEFLSAPPNSQSFLLPLMIAAALEVDPAMDPLGPRAGELAEIFAAGLRVRDELLADPRGLPAERRLDPSKVRLADAAPPSSRRPSGAATGDTVAVVAADDAGNCVSLLQSLFGSFGAGLLDPRTGILFHNRGAGFSLDEGSPNLIAGGKRPAHTLSPAMVLEDGRPRTVIATMGGSAQPQILTEVLMRLRHGDDPLAAVSAPRWTVGGFGGPETDGRVLVEESVPAAAREALEGLPLPTLVLPDRDENVGHAQLIVQAEDGGFAAASDPRSEGEAIVARR